jgi:hypothetical protein
LRSQEADRTFAILGFQYGIAVLFECGSAHGSDNGIVVNDHDDIGSAMHCLVS